MAAQRIVKKPLIIASVSVLLLAACAVAVFQRSASLQSDARRAWKDKSIAGISDRVANPDWPGSELARLKARSTGEPGDDAGWLSDSMILMRNGDWLAYSNICQKQNKFVYDLFLARGSDGKWYYSTYHFCAGMIVLRSEDQSKDLAEFTRTYFLRTFDGQSDDCLQKTWQPDNRAP